MTHSGVCTTRMGGAQLTEATEGNCHIMEKADSYLICYVKVSSNHISPELL